MNYWTAPTKDILQNLNTSEKGISNNKANEILKKLGKNTVNRKDKKSLIKIFLSQFANPLIIILLFVSITSFWSSDNINGIVIMIMLSINAILGTTQEFKAQKSLEKLQKLIKIRSKVLREGKVEIVESEHIVPGDIVILNKGDYVPADIRLIESTNLIVNESALTGESIEVNKNFDATNKGTEPQDIDNGIFQGSFVVEGYAKGVVILTGYNTFLGKSVTIGEKADQQTNFIKKLNQFSKALFFFVILITTFTVVVNVYLGRDLLNSFILGVSLALGITPETMPIILSLSLSNAAYKLSQKKLLIKRLNVFEDLGNVDVICTDKTGTITTGILDPEHFFDTEFKESEEVMKLSALCNAYNTQTNYQIMTNTIDSAIWEKLKGLKHQVIKKLNKVWDFDFESRLMGINIDTQDDENLLIVKGAYERILEQSTLHLHKQGEIKRRLKTYENLGYRIIAVAKKKVTNYPDKLAKVNDLSIVGFVLLIDTPRKNMIQTFNHLEKLSVKLKIITGDSSEVTKGICNKVGLEITDNKVLTGDELEKIFEKSEKEFDEIVNKYNVFTRVAPGQKLKIIESLRKQGHVVGYVGDGINDVGALKVADVSISVDSGADVAKDCSDIIVLDRGLDTITQGVIEGRKVFNNTMKFIFSTMSSSFGNVITITFASLFLKFIPLLPLQVILLDSLTDFQHLAISTDTVDEEMLSKPRNWDMKIFVKFTIFWGIISTLFDIFHIAMITAFTNSPELFRSTWMIESVLSEILATMAIRTPRPFFKSTPSFLLIVFSFVPIIAVFALIYSKFGLSIFGLSQPTLGLIFLVIVIVGIYFIAIELLKRKYFVKFWGIKY